MIKNRIKLLVVATCLVSGIYMLPKYNVNTNAEKQESSLAQETTHSSSDGHDHSHDEKSEKMHSVHMDETLASEAESLIKRFKNSENSEERINLANSLYQLYSKAGMLDSAAYYAESSIPKSSVSVEDFIKVGNAYYEAFGVTGSREKANELSLKAREFLSKAMELNPEDLEVKAKLAMTYVASTAPMKAVGLLREVLEKDPSHETALFNYGMMCIQSNQFSKGVEKFTKLVETNPSHLQGRYYLGVCLFESGKKQEAKGHFDLLKKLSNDAIVIKAAEDYLARI